MGFNDFNAGEECNLYSLKKGEYFMEDTIPDVYQVEYHGYSTSCCGVVVYARDVSTGEMVEFYRSEVGNDYAQPIIKMVPKE